MSTKSNRSPGAAPTPQKLRHETGPGMSLTDSAFLTILFASIILVPMALFAMGEERGVAASVKYLVVGFAAAGAAYAVNKIAVDKLAGLHAIGFRSAGAVAVTAILITGSGTALGSLTGLLYGSVETKIYQEAGQELADYIGAANEVVLVTERLGPATQAVAENITQTKACEIREACLSNGNRGAGPMSRALGTAEAQGYSIAQALQAGLLERDKLLDDLNRLNSDYNKVLADGDLSVGDRRGKLQALHAEARQGVSALREAMPVAVLQGYVSGLQSGARIPGNADGSRILSAFLRGHGDALAEQMDRLPESELVAPDFPDRPGMLEVLKYLPAYLAIAGIVIVGESVLPIALYLMTYLRLVWQIEKQEGALQVSPKDDFDGLINLPKDLKDDGGSS